MSDASEKKWYVIRGISGQENKIKDYIEGEVNSCLLYTSDAADE